MGKKKKKDKDRNQRLEEEKGNKVIEETEGKFLLGKPKFKKLENGRYKCVETGHELPADAREPYAHTKHCRLGLINSALARNKAPLNMFHQDPISSSRLICKLTGHTVNKTEEHIWKHLNGKRFLNMLEKEEAEAGKKASDGFTKDECDQNSEKVSKIEDGLKKKKKKKKDKKKKKKKDDGKIISEVMDSEDKDIATEEIEFWMPPVGERWDFDDGKDRWGSGSESESDSGPESDDENEADVADNGSNKNTTEHSKSSTKRTSIDIELSDSVSRNKKKKIQST